MPNRMEPLLNTVMLLSKTEITLDADALLQSMLNRFGDVDQVSIADDGSALIIGFPEYMVEYNDGRASAQFAIFKHKQDDIPSDYLAPYIQQTWDWDEAHEVVPACPYRMMVSDMMATGLERHQRMALFHKAMMAVLDVLPCDAMAWHASQKIVNPADYLRAHQSDEPNPLFGALNVRMFTIQNTDPPQMVMDTVGLSIFGLPDIQCHFVRLDPPQVAILLFNVGHYIFEHGDVINDGETVQGLTSDDKWKCQHEDALVEPKRVVLDIHPGTDFAAGSRN